MYQVDSPDHFRATRSANLKQKEDWAFPFGDWVLIVLVLAAPKSGSVCVGPSFVSPMIHEDLSWSLTLWFSREASV